MLTLLRRTVFDGAINIQTLRMKSIGLRYTRLEEGRDTGMKLYKFGKKVDQS